MSVLVGAPGGCCLECLQHKEFLLGSNRQKIALSRHSVRQNLALGCNSKARSYAPWEDPSIPIPQQTWLHNCRSSLISSNGASDYGNKFGVEMQRWHRVVCVLFAACVEMGQNNPIMQAFMIRVPVETANRQERNIGQTLKVQSSTGICKREGYLMAVIGTFNGEGRHYFGGWISCERCKNSDGLPPPPPAVDLELEKVLGYASKTLNLPSVNNVLEPA
nr:probable phosphoribosylformylglycinamidine synthase, chloroplastic/mitochondrial [Ipomoea batatas]